VASLTPAERLSERRGRIAWSLGIFAIGLSVRVLHVWYLTGSVFSNMTLGDAKNYVTWAQEIAAGDWLGSGVFYQAPLYPYFLAGVYSFAGEELLGIRLVQAALGSASCVFLAQAGWNFFSRPVGVAAGFILAVYAPAIFADAQIQKSVLDLFFVCLALWILSGIAARPRLGSCAALGASIGLLTLSRENALIFPVVLVPWLMTRLPASRNRRLACAAIFLVAMAAMLFPVAVRNWHVAGEFHLTTSHFGHNFFIGNNPEAVGVYAPLTSGRGDPRIERQDAIDIAEKALGRELSAAEVSRYFFQLGLHYIWTQPLDWLGLMAKKFVLAFNAVEIVDTEDQYTHAESSPPLRAAGWLFHFGVLAPLALLGVWVTFSNRSRLLPLYGLFLSYMATMLVFYVFGRYRLPLIPFLALFAGAGVVGVGRFVTTQRASQIAAVAAASVGLAVFCNWPVLDKRYMRSVTHYNVGNELIAAGRTKEAIPHYHTAIALYARNARAMNNLGVLAAARGEIVRASAHFERALEIDPDYAEANFNLARTRRDTGKPMQAVESFLRGLRAESDRAEIYAELGQLYVATGQLDRAVRSFERALQVDPALVGVELSLQRAQQRQRREGEAPAP
jgi:tetratricopeptide (TPR) repeat protein